MGLIVAGVLAFVCYVVVFEKIVPKDSETEITLFTTAFQGFGYLVMMGIANACYSLGPLVERLLRPTNPKRFRKISYTLGFGFSFALPFAIPILVLMLN
ncbi:MAG TPA: hypothetical protein VEM39_04205 [Myxococcaceae bacterium]|nr:hypothetical protein [Myxococcaceae bacterium]